MLVAQLQPAQAVGWYAAKLNEHKRTDNNDQTRKQQLKNHFAAVSVFNQRRTQPNYFSIFSFTFTTSTSNAKVLFGGISVAKVRMP